MILSKEAEQFVQNLRTYLIVSGKDEQEIEEIIEELEDHLQEAEKDNKSISSIIGQSPAQYMESISKEMKTNVKDSLKAGLAIVIGALSIAITRDIVQGEINYSLFKILSMLLVFFIFTAGIVMVAKKLSRSNVSDTNSIIVLSLFLLMPSILFFIIFYFLDSYIVSPMITITGAPLYIIGFLVAVFLTYLSIWSKSWIIPFVIFIIIGPDIVQKIFGLSHIATLNLAAIFNLLAFIGLIVYSIFTYRKKR